MKSLFKKITFSFLFLTVSLGVFSQNKTRLNPDAIVNVNDSVVIRLNDYEGTLKWQKSSDLGMWENIPYATKDTLLFVADVATYFRAEVIAGDCDPFYSDTTYVGVLNVNTLPVTDITPNSAFSGGNIISDDGIPVTGRGLVWSRNEYPDLMNNEGYSSAGEGVGIFTSELSDLISGNTYYLRAYAISSGHTIYGNQITFNTPETYTLTIQASPDDSGEVNGAGVYEAGSQITISAIPNDGFVFVNWTGDVDYIDNPNLPSPSVIMPDNDINLTANFEIQTYSLDLQVTPDDSGEVTGAGVYEAGSQITISAIPNDGFVFVNWTGDVDYINDTEEASIIATMPPHNISLIANFEEENIGPDWPTDTETEVVEVFNPTTGKTWMDRNLGASRPSAVSTDAASYGNLYQWGRAADGHELIDRENNQPISGTTIIFSIADLPGHENFIISNDDANYDWRVPQNDDLWQGINGINNPCPSGFRLPTEAEFMEEMGSWSSSNATGAFNSPLKFSVAGSRNNSGLLLNVNSIGNYWSSTVNATQSRLLNFSNSGASILDGNRTNGNSIRCIKDYDTFTLNLLMTPDGLGEVVGAGDYPEGAEVTIKAFPNSGYNFLSWTGDIEYVENALEAFTSITMPAYDINLIANFEYVDSIVYGEGVVDIHGNYYSTVIIGNQEWMAENLKVTKDANGNNIFRSCYDNNAANCDLYGGLYSWNVVMNGENSSFTSPSLVQGICPTGWYVPSVGDWEELVDYLVDQGYPNDNVVNGAGNALKSCWQVSSPLAANCATLEHPRWDSHTVHYGTNDFGFSALPGGFILANLPSQDLGKQGKWWTTTDAGASRSYFTNLHNNTGNTGISWSDYLHRYSLRCIKGFDTYLINSQVYPEESGTVTGAGYYGEGTTVAILATPSEGYLFVNWTGDTEYLIDANSAETIVIMPAVSINLTANFVAYHTLSLNVIPFGTGTANGSGDYLEGEQVTITATPNTGYDFVNWSGDIEFIADTNADTITLTMPGQNVNLTANFEGVEGHWPTDTLTVVVDVLNPSTGKTWMDRNLGANRAATSSTDAEAYGDLYQWGRAADGHQLRTSSTTSTLSSGDSPGHGDYILSSLAANFDWRTPPNNNLWQGVNSINNPCPASYRLPTEAELNAEYLSWNNNNSDGAYASPLKLPVAGLRSGGTGSLQNVGSRGTYWSSSVNDSSSRYLVFDSTGVAINTFFRAFGQSVRCIKD